MTVRIATKSTNGFSYTVSGFVKSSLAAVALMATFGITEVSAATTQIKCGASKGITKTCNAKVGKIKGITLQTETGRRTCVAGKNWGQSGNSVWTKNGCKGKFDVYYGKLTKAERRKLRGIAGNAPAAAAHSSNHDDLGKGLVVLGGLLVGAAILNEIFDGNQYAPVATHQPIVQPTYGSGQWNNNQWTNGHGNGQGNGIGINRRKRIVNLCSSAAVSDALANGYSNAWMSRVKKVVKTGNRRFKVTGTITQQFRQPAPYQNTGYRSARHWNNASFSWGFQNQPQYVTYEEKRTFSCVVKNGQVRKLRKW